MKYIVSYIIEALKIKPISEVLKINSKSKISSNADFEKYILEIIYAQPEDADPEEVKLIKKWIKDTNIEYLTVVSTESVLDDFLVYDEEVTGEDLFNKYKGKENINIVLDDDIYDTFSENIGELIYKDKYERIEYYINKDMLTFKFRRSNYIFFISDNKSDPI